MTSPIEVFRLDRNETTFQCEAYELGGVLEPELLEDARAVIVNRLAASGKLDGDLGCRTTLCKVGENFELSGRQPGKTPACGRFS